jgi:hypothetical protein
VNPVVMTTLEGPNVGQPWRVQFDTTGFPTVDTTDIVIYPRFAAVPVPTQWGEILLSLSGPRLFWSTRAGSGTVEHVNILARGPSIVGLDAATQGILRSAGKVVAPCNGELIGIGCFGQ